MSDIEKAMLEYGRKVIDLESRLSQLQALLGKERDEFGKKETELKAENERIGNIAVQYEHDIDSLQAENARYRETLEIIAKNGCCSPCREAGLFANSALHPVGTEGGRK